MKPYPKTKPSGVQWLGEVPEYWDVKAIKWETPVFRGASPRPIDDPVYFDDEGEFAWVRIADVTAAGDYLESTTQQLSRLGSSLSVKLRPGALFLSIAGTVGKPCITKIKCCIHDGFVYFPGFGGETKFLFYVFASGEPYRGLGKLGTQLNLNTDTVGSIVMGFPPPTEQAAIAAYLDRETGRMDELVGKKRELIERLKEKRTALISRTVTRGLPADLPPETLAQLEAIAGEKLPLNPPLKLAGSSAGASAKAGIDWLGEVPEHWEVKRLKHVLPRLYSGVSVNSENAPTQDDSPAVLKTSCVYGNRFTPEENKVVLENEWDRVACPATKDSVIVSRMNTPELVGSCGYVDRDYLNLFLPDRLWIARFSKHQATHGKFAWYLIISDEICSLTGSLATGTSGSMKNLSQEAFLNIPIAVPPLPEQRAIAAYLDEETAKLDALVAKVETAIERLQEYRTALITAAVTGKIDVRNLVKSC